MFIKLKYKKNDLHSLSVLIKAVYLQTKNLNVENLAKLKNNASIKVCRRR